MHMASSARQWTVEEVWALPDDGNRYELVDGELLVTPSPSMRHQHVAGALFYRLSGWLKSHDPGVAIAVMAPADVQLTPTSLVQPDLFVIPLRDGRPPRELPVGSALLLAVEVISPASARADRIRKRVFYLREGVPEYWILDPEARVVERWRHGEDRPHIIAERLSWQPFSDQPPFELSVAEFFDEALGPEDAPRSTAHHR